MNTVYFGNHAYGVEAAAQTYFSRHAKKLSLLQSALLAGLPQSPSVYDPFKNPRQALRRRNDVLKALYESGDISYGNYQEALKVTDLKLKPGRIYSTIREPYFFGYVRDELIRKYGPETVRSGGLKVYTTIDRRMQRAANRAVTDQLYYDDDPASAVVAIDPRSGAIKTMTAVTPGHTGNQFNLAAQARRQAGSTFKTFVLTQAVSQGINPDTTTYLSAPLFYQPYPNQDPWEVSTYSHTYLGSTSITHATLASDNTVYARLTLDLGAEKVAQMANRLGVASSLKTKEGAYVPSVGLGSIGVSPLDMASAYATIAAGGIYSKPMAIQKVAFAPKADGTVEEDRSWGKPKRRRVIADWVAAEVTRILEENIQSGTGVGANIGRTAGGKTGTTEEHADAWFCGITPTLSTTVWVGYPQAEIPMTNVHGISVAGGTFPASIWRLFMEEAIGSTPERDFPEAQSEPIWHSFTPGSYGGPPPPPTYYYNNPPPPTTTTATQPPPAAPQPPPPPPAPRPVPVPIPPPPPPEPAPPPPAPPPPQP
jgi:penicillin-binding protein 1A